MDPKPYVVDQQREPAVPSSMMLCACCHRPEEIDLLLLCSRCGQFVHEAGDAGCSGVCACEARRNAKTLNGR
jgi:hypothetical protein